VISHELRCVFVHIQKTGGSSVRQALNLPQHDPDKHRFAQELRTKCDPQLWQSYFKFAFVRNPWDRMVSWWSMIVRNAQNASEGRQTLNGFQRFIVSRAATFEEFLLNCDEEYPDRDGSKWIFRNQIDYIADGEGQLLVDYVGRFERLKEDFALIAGRLNLTQISIPHLNRSPRLAYTNYYTNALAKLVGERYARDVAAFGYRFGAS
jgi:hypothetical protein